MRVLTLLLCLALPAAAQEKTYDLKLEAPLRAGQKTKLMETSVMSMTLHTNGQLAASSEERKQFEAIESVLQSDGKGNAELRQAFLKAQRLEDGKMTSYGFHGRTLLVKRVKGQADRFTYADGSSLAKVDLDALKGALFSNSGDEKGEAALQPPKPVKVGESWSPDIHAVAKLFSDDEMDVVVAGSKARFLLRSVEMRGGLEFGKIDGSIELAVKSMGPLALDTAIPITITINMDVCVDGTSEDGTLKMTMRMKGSSTTRVETTKLKIDIDMAAEGNMSRTTMLR